MENKINELARHLEGINGRFEEYKDKELMIVDIFGSEYDVVNIVSADTDDKIMVCITMSRK